METSDTFEPCNPDDPGNLFSLIETLKKFTGVILFCFKGEGVDVKEEITGNFIARGMTCLESIYIVWKRGAEQDAWILYRSLLDRLFHLKALHKKDDFPEFKDFSFKSLYEARQKLLSEQNLALKAKIPESLKTLQKANKERYDNIVSSGIKWNRPKAKDMAKEMDLDFLYSQGYDYASTHVHPMASDGEEDFARLTSPTQDGNIPDATVVRNSIIAQILLIKEGLNISDLSWRRIVFDFTDEVLNYFQGDDISYRVTFYKLANAGPDFNLCQPST